MKFGKLLVVLVGLLMGGLHNVEAQVTGVQYQLRYDTTECRYDAMLIISNGNASSARDRLQFSAQYSLVVPAFTVINITEFHNPIEDNIAMTGTQPATWSIGTVVDTPSVTPNRSYIGITVSTSPTAYYNTLTEGDTLKLFSFTTNPFDNCGDSIRIFENGVDPSSSAPGMNGGDFSNGFTIGGPLPQKYVSNVIPVQPPKPNPSAMNDCSMGLAIDLNPGVSTCQQPVTFNWTGPNGYSGSTEDVSIIPATAANNGTYNVTVTDAIGCESTFSIEGVAKPQAGIDQGACTNQTINLQGSEPSNGTWLAGAGNPGGATLTQGSNGAATVSFDGTAIGNYEFIYEFMGCTDTMVATVSVADAGPDPNTVGCFSQGSSTLSAVGTGTWSVDPSSPGTATFGDPNSANTTVSGFSVPGTYTLTWTVGACTDQVQVVANDVCDCAITNNILQTINPATYCDNSGNILIDGGQVPISGTYLWQEEINGGGFVDAPGTNDAEDYTTINYNTGVYRFRRLFNNDTGLLCSDTSNIVTLTVLDQPGEPTNLVANPNPACLGETVNLTVDQLAGAIYTWSSNPSSGSGLGSSTTNSNDMTPTVDGVYTISVTQELNGCVSSPASLNVTILPTPDTPTGSDIVGTDPSACSANDGFITIIGYIPNEVYTVNYTANGIPQSPNITANGAGELIINGLSAGTYSNFEIINSDNCNSGIFTGSVNLFDPSAPPAPSGISASPTDTCLGIPVTITVNNNPGAVYTWSSNDPNAGLGSSTTNSVVMNALAAGQYLIEVTQTVNGCVSPATGIDVLINDTPPTPDAGTVNGLDPMDCGASNGSITISSLPSLTTFIVNYNHLGIDSMRTLSTDVNGVITISGLPQGTYTNFSLTNFSNCTSGEFAGPIILTDPNSPPAPSNLAANPNPVCVGEQIDLSADPLANATFDWSVGANATLGGSTTNTNNINSTVAGTYTVSVTQTVAGCVSPESTIDVTFLELPPEFAGSSSADPTTCGGTDGSITLEGLAPNTTYNLSYTANNNPVNVSSTSDAQGDILITGLGAGVYQDFQLSNAGGCTNTVLPGPINLVDPGSPAAPTGLAAMPDVVCLGESIDLSVDNINGATYSWSASPANSGIISSTTNTTTMTPTEANTFTVSVFQTIAGCSSPTASTIVIVNPLPRAPEIGDFTTMNPSVCTGSDGSITIGGYEAFRTFTVDFNQDGTPQSVTVGTNAAGEIVITGLPSGTYTNFTITDSGNCVSPPFAGPVNLSDPGAPDAPENLTANPNPACLGETVQLSVTNNPGATYTWSINNANGGLVASTTNTTSMTPSAIGTYTVSVIQTLAGCTSAPSELQVEILDVPPTPTVGDFSTIDPVTCGVNDGSISITGFNANESYTVTYMYNGTPVNTTVTSTVAGAIIINQLAPGTYMNFQFTNAGNCSSGVFAGPVILSGPPAPDAPSNLTAVPNPVCLMEVVNLSVDNNPNATYTWTASDPSAGLVASTTNNTSMTALIDGVYTISVIQTVNGCSSPAATVDVIVNPLPPTPDATTVASFNPTACATADGSIVISGYVSGTDYDVNYEFNFTPVTVNVTSDGSGNIVLDNLGAGSYSNISISDDNGCGSGTFAGPIVLIEPDVPDAPNDLIGIPNPLCLGETVDLSTQGEPNATFNWTVSDQNGNLGSSTTNVNTMTPFTAGVYTINVTQTVNGCTSPAASLEVLALQNCINPDFGVTFEDVELTGSLTTNDKERAGSTYSNPTIDGGNNPNGTLPTVNSDGTYTFTASTAGEYSFRVDVCPPTTAEPCESMPLVITVLEEENDQSPPVANHDYIAVNGTNSISIVTLANDKCQTFPSCTLNGFSVVTNPVNGTFNTNSQSYTANSGFVGRDSFQYEVCQSPTANPTNCDREWVYINVYPSQSDYFTSAMDDYAETFKNTPLVTAVNNGVGPNDSDPVGGNQIYGAFSSSVTGKGSIIFNSDGSYEFTPELDYFGPVDFAYEVCRNGTSLCDSATLHILVKPQDAISNIGDYVWEDEDGDGIQDSNEDGISGMFINLRNENDELIASALSDGNGEYLFEGIPQGNYYLQYLPNPKYTATLPNRGGNDELDSDITEENGEFTTSIFTAVGGVTDLSIDGGFYECVRIGDNVWYDYNENDIFDSFENGINGIEVRLWRIENGTDVLWETMETGHKPGTPSDDGWYEFCAPPGTYYIEVVMPPNGVVLVRPFRGNDRFRDSDINNANGPGTTSSFTLRSGENKLDIGAGYAPMAMAGNLVWEDTNQNGLQDPGEPKVGGVTVEAFDAVSRTMIGSDVTDGDGIYMIDYLDTRDIYIQFAPPGGYSATAARTGDPNLDSDVDHSNGYNTTQTFSLNYGEAVYSIDMGLSQGVLPLEWLFVNATNEGEYHQIEWATASEINVSGFIIERKLLESGEEFSPLITEELKAKNGLDNRYEYLDIDVNKSGTYIYRIRQNDFDGAFTYSDQVRVLRRGDGKVHVYPNPTTDFINVEYSGEIADEVELEIIGVNGIQVKSSTLTVYSKGLNLAKIDVTDIDSGMYTIRVIQGAKVNSIPLMKIE